MYAHPVSPTRAGRLAWSIVRRPAKSRGFPAEQERLATAEDLIRYRR